MTFEIGDKVLTNTGLYMNGAWRDSGLKGKVVALPDGAFGLLTVKFKEMDQLRFIRPEYLILRSKKKAEKELLSTEEDVEQGEEPEVEAVPDLHEVRDNPEVQAALALVLERIEEIKELLTVGPRHEITVNVHSTTEESPEEEPAPEPAFKKAKEVKAGDMLYTEAGVWDKVTRIETKDSGYTSLFGAFGNKITQVPSGRVVQVLEEVS